MSDALVLGMDTSAAHCAAALLRGPETLIDSTAEEMGRGQAERLMPMIEEMLARHGVSWNDLARIGVGIGPGNFTGIRISVAAARGLALALDIPAVGVSTFDAISLGRDVPHLPAVPAPRDQLYLRPADGPPRLVGREEAEGAPSGLALPPAPVELAARIARCAAAHEGPAPAPAPLYIRAADAAPARDSAPLILDRS